MPLCIRFRQTWDDFLFRYGDLTIFKMAAIRHLELSKLEFNVVTSIPFCFFVQNFIEIGQSAAELWPKTIFNMAAVCPCK